jgi:RHS repeat-associated protein
MPDRWGPPEHTGYDSYGNLITSAGSSTNPFRFKGRIGYYFDGDEGRYYLRARFLCPTRGLFLSRDPLMAASNGRIMNGSQSIWGVSLYSYALNNPAIYDDPSGLASLIIAVPAILICLYGSYCLAFTAQSWFLEGGRTPNPAQRACFDKAVAAFKEMGMPNTASCAGSASIGTKIPGGNSGDTPIDGLCLCPQYIYISPPTAKCSDCGSLVDLISTMYHECVHTHQCGASTTENSRETEAYCNEAAFDHMKLQGMCAKGLCGSGLSNVNDCLKEVQAARNLATRRCQDLGGTVNYQIPFN